MLRRILVATIVVSSMLILSGRSAIAQQPATAPASQPVAADPTTPKGTLTLLSRATATGDSTDVKDLFYATTPLEEKLAAVLIQRTEVYAKFRKALVKAMGEDSATQLTGNSADDEALAEQRISQAEQKIADDKATVQMQAETGQPPVKPVELVKVDGKWKLPVGKLTEGMQTLEVEAQLAEFKTMSDVVAQVTGEVEKGQYKTADEVSDALRGKLLTAMQAAQAAEEKAQSATKPANP